MDVEREPARKHLIIEQAPYTLRRRTDQAVDVVNNNTGEKLATFPRDSWEEIRDFFIEITDPDVLL